MNSCAQLLKTSSKETYRPSFIKTDDTNRTELKTYVMASTPENIHIPAYIHATHVKLIPSHGIRKALFKKRGA